MKKTLLLITLLSIVSFSYSQKSYRQIIPNQKLKSEIDTLQFQISYTNYCLEKYREEKLIGLWLQIGGAVSVSFFNISQLNGMRSLEDNYKHKFALAGGNLAAQIGATTEFQIESNKIKKRQDIITIVGGVAFLAGSLLHIDSYKWLKRTYLTTSEDGIGIKIKF